MCGIAGAINIADPARVKTMLESMKHRGPDDSGLYSNNEQCVYLGHRRLSIIDLSSGGHQPMSDKDKSIWVTFNGEIYNYKKLRDELTESGHTFRSTSDTEIIVEGYKEFGKKIFEKIDGMWAIALFDKNRGEMILSRDPAGIKPLYIYKTNDSLLFASEINSLKKAVGESLTINHRSLNRFLAHGYIYGDDTIYHEIIRAPQGKILIYDISSLKKEERLIYFPQKKFEITNMRDAVERFDALFSQSVAATLQSDVPVGIFLSGGIDSAIMAQKIRELKEDTQAFTIGFSDREFDESNVASDIASHFNLPYCTINMTGSEIAPDVEKILDSFGEPFADTSALPTYYLSKLAREHGVKVALAGDGADELFGGYQTHYLPALAEVYRHFPKNMDTIFKFAADLIPTTFSKLGIKEKTNRFLHSARETYTNAHAGWKHVFTKKDIEELLSGDQFEKFIPEDALFSEFFSRMKELESDRANELMKIDFLTFLTGSCLIKSDISAMQHGLEVRLPFLNKDIIDFAYSLDSRFKVSPFKTKKILRQSLSKYLPSKITRMKKRGFVPPLALWLTQELKPVMTEILSERNIAKVGFLRYNYVDSLIKAHLDKRVDNSKKIWALMSLVRFYIRQ